MASALVWRQFPSAASRAARRRSCRARFATQTESPPVSAVSRRWGFARVFATRSVSAAAIASQDGPVSWRVLEHRPDLQDPSQNPFVTPLAREMRSLLRQGCVADAEVLLERAEQADRDGSANRQPGVVEYTMLVNGWARAGRLDEAEFTLRRMWRAGVPPNAHTFASLLNGCATVQPPDLDRALRLIDRMRQDDIALDVHVFGALLKCHASAGEPRFAAEALEEMERQGIPLNATCLNTALLAHTNAKDPEAAENLLLYVLDSKSFPPQETSFSTVMEGWAAARDPARVEALLEEMRRRNVIPGKHSYTALLKAFVRAGKPQEALGLLESLADGAEGRHVRADAKMYAPLLRHCEAKGNTTFASKLITHMEEHGVARDLYTWNLFLATLARRGHATEAEKVMEMICEASLTPNRYTYRYFVKALCRARCKEKAQAVIREAAEAGFRSDPVIRTMFREAFL